MKLYTAIYECTVVFCMAFTATIILGTIYIMRTT